MVARPMAIDVRVNGRRHLIEARAWHTLLEVLRDELGLTGTKECCAEGECGACTVLIDGHAVNSCLMLGVEADGHEVTTIEGLAPGGQLSRLQAAFLERGAVQCGFCIPGMVVAAHYLLAGDPDPTADDVREGLSGNLCRCGGYNQICAAVADAARGGEAQGER
jgi:aerobic-type carbon monoxide dehydrogenase small subunit (CoxS/CutS family)